MTLLTSRSVTADFQTAEIVKEVCVCLIHS